MTFTEASACPGTSSKSIRVQGSTLRTNVDDSALHLLARHGRFRNQKRVIQHIARHLDVHTSVTPEQLRDLMKKTDRRRLTNPMEELAEPTPSGSTTTASNTDRSR